MWQEVSSETRASAVKTEYDRAVGNAFVDFLNADITRDSQSSPLWIPNEFDVFWDTAQTIIDPSHLAIVVKAWDAHPERREKQWGQGVVYETTFFRHNPSVDHSRYYDPKGEGFGSAYNEEYAAFQPFLKVGVLEVILPTNPPRTERHPRDIRFIDRPSELCRTTLVIPEFGGVTLSHKSADENGMVNAKVVYGTGSIEAKGEGTSFTLYPPYMRADGEGSISGIDLKRLFAGEPSNDKWGFDKKTGLVRFRLKSREVQPGNKINPWYVEFKLGDFDINALKRIMSELRDDERDMVDLLFKTGRTLSEINPFARDVYVAVNFDRLERRQSRRHSIF